MEKKLIELYKEYLRALSGWNMLNATLDGEIKPTFTDFMRWLMEQENKKT